VKCAQRSAMATPKNPSAFQTPACNARLPLVVSGEKILRYGLIGN